MDIKQTLSNNSVFSHMNDEVLEKIVKIGQMHRFSSGEWIAHNGDIWPNLFFIQKGQVTAIKESPEGRSLTLVTIEAGEIFWSSSGVASLRSSRIFSRIKRRIIKNN